MFLLSMQKKIWGSQDPMDNFKKIKTSRENYGQLFDGDAGRDGPPRDRFISMYRTAGKQVNWKYISSWGKHSLTILF